MDQVRRYTRDYLLYLREKIGAHLEDGGDLPRPITSTNRPTRILIPSKNWPRATRAGSMNRWN